MSFDLKKAIDELADEIREEVIGYARYKVQNDFNEKLVPYIAKKTGHPNLAATCFCDVDLKSTYSLNVSIYNDSSYIEGDYRSNSAYHQSGKPWESISEHFGLHRDDFWSNRFLMNDDDKDNISQHGAVDVDWLADNFWDGIVYSTNGWPRSDADYLEVYKKKTIPASYVIDKFVKDYQSKGYFDKYIKEALNRR